MTASITPAKPSTKPEITFDDFAKVDLRIAKIAEDLIGKSIVIVANLAPRNIRGEESRGMLLAASNAAKGSDDRSVVVMTPMSEIEPGSVVS